MMDRKKELKMQYKQMRPQMGIFIIRFKADNMCYIEATSDLKGRMNSTKFQLEAGNYSKKVIQEEWKKHGKANFSVEILEELEYDKDESKMDYTDDLALLQMIWEERLLKENMKFYKK